MKKALAILVLLSWVAACGGDDDADSGGGNRDVTGIKECKVALEGYYYVGGFTPQTGTLAKYGDGGHQAMLVAAQEINDAGGIKGKPLGIIRCDTKGDAKTTAALFKELAAASPIVAVVGPVDSSSVLEIGADVAKAKKVVVAYAATSPDVTNVKDDGFVFRTCPSGTLQGLVGAAIAKREGYKKVIAVNRDDSFGNGLTRVFLDNFKGTDPSTPSFAYDATKPDYATQAVSKIKAVAPDAVYLVAFPDDGAAVVSAAATDSALSDVKWLHADGCQSDEFVTKVADNDYLEGQIGTGVAVPSGPDYDTFAAAYKTAWGKDPETFSPNAYDGMYLIAMAMQLADNPDDGTQVRDAMAKTKTGDKVKPGEWKKFLDLAAADKKEANYVGASGPVDFDKSGDVLANTEEWTIKDGKITTKGCWSPEIEPCP